MILLYHNIVPDDAKHGFANQSSVCLFKSQFKKQIEILSKFYNIIPLSDYLNYYNLNNSAQKNTLSITFDDGTYLTYECLKDVLQKINLSATIFVTTCQIDEGDLIIGAYLNALCYEQIYAQVKINGLRLSLITKKEQVEARKLLASYVKKNNYDKAFINNLKKHYPIPNTIKQYYRGMSSAQIRDAMNGDYIKIGSHSVNHFDLGKLTQNTQKKEIINSKNKLESISKKEIKFFAYPSGSYNLATLNIIEKAGYSHAFAVKSKNLKSKMKFEFPRVGIYSPSITKLFLKLILNI